MPKLIVSIHRLSGPQRSCTFWLAFVGATLLSFGIFLKNGNILNDTDSFHYMSMANHRMDMAMLPFACHQLGVLLVQAFVTLLHLTIAHSFVLEGAIGFGILLSIVLYSLIHSDAPVWIIPAIAGLFFWTLQLENLVMPDLFYAALLSCLLLLLRRGNLMLAALMMFPLMLARESTLLTLLCFLIAGWRLLRVRESVVAILATVAGALLVKRLTAGALANQERISPTFYMVAKMPWNFLKNVLGLNPWANVYPACAVPRWQMPLHIGTLHAVGFCTADFHYPITALACASASFGLFPLLLFKLRRVCIESVNHPGRDAIFLRFCLLYGVVSFLLTPLLGESFLRLYFYSWPLFLVAMPILMGAARASFSSTTAALLFLALHLALSWSWMFLDPLPVIWIALVVYPAGWLLLYNFWQIAPETIPAAVDASQSLMC